MKRETEHTANELLAAVAMQQSLVPTTRIIPSWQMPSTCKRRARGISVTKRIAKLLGL
jgi:hypothetical protein